LPHLCTGRDLHPKPGSGGCCRLPLLVPHFADWLAALPSPTPSAAGISDFCLDARGASYENGEVVTALRALYERLPLLLARSAAAAATTLDLTFVAPPHTAPASLRDALVHFVAAPSVVNAIKYLDLEARGGQEEGASRYASAALLCLAGAPRLSDLYLHYFAPSAATWAALPTFPALETLILDSMGVIDGPAAMSLAVCAPTLRVLSVVHTRGDPNQYAASLTGLECLAIDPILFAPGDEAVSINLTPLTALIDLELHEWPGPLSLLGALPSSLKNLHVSFALWEPHSQRVWDSTWGNLTALTSLYIELRSLVEYAEEEESRPEVFFSISPTLPLRTLASLRKLYFNFNNFGNNER
jgi:hypothetical protein